MSMVEPNLTILLTEQQTGYLYECAALQESENYKVGMYFSLFPHASVLSMRLLYPLLSKKLLAFCRKIKLSEGFHHNFCAQIYQLLRMHISHSDISSKIHLEKAGLLVSDGSRKHKSLPLMSIK